MGGTLVLHGTTPANGGYLFSLATIGYVYFQIDLVIKQATIAAKYTDADI